VKIYISVDMEGCSGVTHGEHTSEAGNDYQIARRYMTGETNAAVEGALAAGATEVIINDAHGGNGHRNILLHELHPDARLVVGAPKDLSQMAAIDASFDAVLFVGYHVREDAYGMVSHSYNSRVVNELRINGELVGETALNAYIAGHFEVPVVMVAGDQYTAEEAEALLPWIQTAVVKETIGHNAAICLHPDRARKRIRDATERALSQLDMAKPLIADTPVTFDLMTKDKAMADAAEGIPGIRRMGPRHLVIPDAQNYLAGYRALIAAINLGAGVTTMPIRR